MIKLDLMNVLLGTRQATLVAFDGCHFSALPHGVRAERFKIFDQLNFCRDFQ